VRPVPSREQIQGWVLGITPYEYFERLIDRPGMLILRTKDRVCEWRGLHLALSDGWREHLGGQLRLLSSGSVDRLQYRVSLPDGRAWFNLYTSGVDFGSWWEITFQLDPQASSSGAWVRYVQSTVHVRLSAQAASTLAAELARSLDGGVKSSLALWRDLRPSSEPQALWLWRWLEKDSAG
jgi:hypothetical protein